MKKVIVIGCPGSGKSIFSKALHSITGLPLYHLDNLFWNADKTSVGKTVFCERLSEVLCQDEWIIDGNYASTMEWRMRECDTVIFLDYPLEVCLDGIRARKGKPRSDLPWTEPEEDDAAFLAFIKSYRLQSRPRVMELLERYCDKTIKIFTTRAEAHDYLMQLTRL